MSVPIIYKDTQYIARKHIFKTTLANDTATCNVMTIVNSNVGIGTTNPRQLLDIQGGNVITNGNVGIGTTNPLYNLHINGTISVVSYNNLPIISSNVVFKTLTVGTARTVNWTLPTYFSYITFEMWGGGGSGGSGGYNTAPYYGSGGEGGDYIKITFPVTNFSGISTITLTIGAGGTGYGDYGDDTIISWGGYNITAYGGKPGESVFSQQTAYNFSQKTYTNIYTYDIIIPGGYGGVYSTNLKNGTNNSIITGISRNYNGTGGGGAGGAGPDSAIPGTGGPGGTNYVTAAIGTAGQNLFSSIETATYGGTYTYIVGGGGGGGSSSTLEAATGGYPGGGGGGAKAATSGPVTYTGGNGGDGLIRITWY